MRRESISLTSIRGFAALWVACYHFQHNLEQLGYNLWPHFNWSFFGYIGVDIFFVLSGFILTAVYRGLAWRNVGAFLTRRGFRIYPMHLAVLGGMLLLWLDAYFRYHVINPTQPLLWLPVCALLLQPFFYHGLLWNAVTWSLSVEFVCYFAFPFAIMAFRRAPLLVLVPLILVLGAIEHHLQIYDLNIWGRDAVARGLVGFGLGMMLRLASERIPAPSALLASLVECLALGGIILCACFPGPPGHGGGAFIPLFAALLILGISYERGIIAWVLNARVCLWLGKISFSLYLLHENVIGVIWMRFPPTRLPFGHYANGLIWTVAVLLLCLALATVTWLLIEEPFRRMGGRVARRMERNIPKPVAPSLPEGDAQPQAAPLPENAEAAVLRV